MRWVLILVMSAGCDRLLQMQTWQPDAPAASIDAPTPPRDADAIRDSPRPPARSCKEAHSQGVASDGVITIDTDGPGSQPPFDVYCDMTTAGGGWTLVWSYGFTNYPMFQSNNNAVTPRPSWDQVSGTPVSTTPPASPTGRGAMDFARWKDIGSEIMVTSTINHWITCTPGAGSLVNRTAGSISCQVVTVVATQCATTAPDTLQLGLSGPALDRGTGFYYYFDGSTAAFYPTHDPCGTNQPNQVPAVADPRGAIYVR